MLILGDPHARVSMHTFFNKREVFRAEVELPSPATGIGKGVQVAPVHPNHQRPEMGRRPQPKKREASVFVRFRGRSRVLSKLLY